MKRHSAHPPVPWAALSQPDVLARLHVALAQGLTLAECAARRARYGPNRIRPAATSSAGMSLWRQLGQGPGLALLAAALLAAVVGDVKAAAGLVICLVLAGLMGIMRQPRAWAAPAALRKLMAGRVRVRREEQEQIISATELVPGDIVFLAAGELVPADGRLLEATGLRIHEALLTGEPEPADKFAAAIPGDRLALEDQHNMAFMGTTVVAGQAVMVVTDTGMNTQLGRAAAAIQNIEPPVAPFWRDLERAGRGLMLASVALAAAVVGLAALQGAAPEASLRHIVSLVVALFPEALPAIVLMAAALGARRLRQQGALARRLQAVTTLGATTAVGADLASALAEDRLIIVAQDPTGRRIELALATDHRTPAILPAETATGTDDEPPSLLFLLAAAALCNDATLRPDPGQPGRCRAFGDPVEAGLLAAAARLGLWKSALDAAFPCVEKLPFDPGRARVTTAHRVARRGGRPRDGATLLDALLAGHLSAEPVFWIALSRGAVSSVLAACDRIRIADRVEPLDAAWRERILAAADEMAGRGMYAMGIAFRIIEPDIWQDDADVLPIRGPELERSLTFAGLIGVSAPPRAGVPEAIAACRAAGIRPILFTAHRPQAARQMGRALGFAADGPILSGPEIERMGPEKLQTAVGDVAICAQVDVGHKLAVAQALQGRGDVVAGVGNKLDDLVALGRADIMVAPGPGAAEVVKQAADLVLLDGAFATLVAAIAEGRAAEQSLRRFVRFALGSNIARVLLLLAMPLLGLPLPFSPLQVLYLNLVVDGLLGVGMALAPARPHDGAASWPAATPAWLRRLDLSLLGHAGLLFGIGLAIGLLAGLQTIHELRWRTLILTGMVFAQAFRVLAMRPRPDAQLAPASPARAALPAAAAAVVVVHLLLLVVPALHRWFDVVPLAPAELAALAAVGSLPLWAGEIGRWLGRRMKA